MSTKRQFKMYLDEDLIERMRRAADKAGKGSGQEVAEEVLSIYLPVWSSVSESTRRAVEYQTKRIAGLGDRALDPLGARQSVGVLKEKAR